MPRSVLIGSKSLQAMANCVRNCVMLLVVMSCSLSTVAGQEQVSTAQDRILDRIAAVLPTLPSNNCRRDLTRTVEAARARTDWAMAMFDASAKFPVAVEYGSVYQLGSYDECLNRSDDAVSSPVTTQYCLTHVQLPGYRVRSISTRHQSLPANGTSTLVHWGLCVPATCTATDVQQLLQTSTGYDVPSTPPSTCHQQTTRLNEKPYTTGQVLCACVLLVFVAMVTFSTCYNYGSSTDGGVAAEKPPSTVTAILRAFSVIENLRKLVQGSKDDHGLGCINGIKACSMVFILGGHALLFMAGGPLLNTGFFHEQQRQVQNAIFLNSPLLVDTFLLLSGFLFARLLLIELDKRKGGINFGMLYLFRYIRLTPAYLAIITIYATWLPRLGDGPLWQQRMALEQQRCQDSWWRNLLYINNYVGTDSMCMFQSWYLAADTQLFILAPLILYPMWRYGRRIALWLIGSLIGVSIVIPFCVTYVSQLDPTFMIFTDEIQDLQWNHYFAHVYGSTHMRATAYLFGLLVGYLVHWMQLNNIRIKRRRLAIYWIVSTICGCSAMLSVTAFYNELGTENYLYNALYAALHRFGWSLSNGWLVLACVTGHGRTLKRLLCWRAFVPISRLTYCAYLVNGLVELYLSAARRTPLYASIASLTAEALSHIILTFLLAVVLCLMFESPIHGLEKILLRRFRPTNRREIDSQSTNNTHSTSGEV
ncbi:nose resistant to fluoxetine protein 6-like [Anopheles aquasalis]|uniref:nose resistant to fluoxetine protein 6-like n=1 Tax=Anopheles aquasalis TaxID=42839 RepID=UPI00215A6ACD|nr:nose resistant to fluoxetine protein 6-like [Anopheles aquasalis]